jgi:hypothetical protein
MKSSYDFCTAKFVETFVDDTIVHYKLNFTNPELFSKYRFSRDYYCNFIPSEQQKLEYIVPYDKVNRCVHLAIENVMLYTKYKEVL